MRSATVLSLPLVWLLAGCPAQGSQPAPTPAPQPQPAPQPTEPDTMGAMSGFADQMCACADRSCRDGVDEKARAYVEANAAGFKEADPVAMRPIEERYKKCQLGSLLNEFEALATEMCACKEATCAEGVNKEFDEWMNDNVNASGTQAQQEQAKQIAEKYTKCMMTAMTATTKLPGMGEKCAANDACSDGLECVKYYGIAGKKGGEFTSCERRCGKGKPACPDGQRCATIADGPGQVCRLK